ncbi:unnamed protein product [Acanthoscelides obtectus]|uniref:DDE Tnp4 domain-containing protein n=1 Tax=Acanthoscelides obtectus TaxID=200917 RepID=A0A9P0VRL6_ACAOB|nr:unnamed protein product [Acanthoscelides obtectus]CAK1682701.1 Putative nuclease HARBI1 [Acanthoscelides obtectus]
MERRLMRNQSDPFSFEDVRFKELFRLNKDMAKYVLNGIIPHLNQVPNPVAVPFFAALHFYATGTYQRVIGRSYDISMSQQSISRAIHEITNAIISTFSEQLVHFPRTALENHVIKQGSWKQEVSLGFAGASHDSYIWRNSLVRNEFEACYHGGDRHSWLLGDSGYPQEPWLMTPIQNALPGSPERRYTDSHIQTRNCVERCIGVLKGRFLCLSNVLRYSPEKVGNIANACVILHNICVAARLDFNLEMLPLQDTDNHLEQGNFDQRTERKSFWYVTTSTDPEKL